MTEETYKTTLRIDNNPSAPDMVPAWEELPDVLKTLGFEQLTNAAADNLHTDNVVVFFNTTNNTFSIYIIEEVSPESCQISFRHERLRPDDHSVSVYAGEEDYSDDPCVTDRDYVGFRMPPSSFGNYLYKVISEKPITNDNLKEAGFRPLSEAKPSDMPQGSVVLLREHKTAHITPVIVNVLSHQTEGDHRLLFWRQSPHVAGEWCHGAIMGHIKVKNPVNPKDHVTLFSKYDYLVLA